MKLIRRVFQVINLLQGQSVRGAFAPVPRSIALRKITVVKPNIVTPSNPVCSLREFFTNHLNLQKNRDRQKQRRDLLHRILREKQLREKPLQWKTKLP
jgi:hypothetical protein